MKTILRSIVLVFVACGASATASAVQWTASVPVRVIEIVQSGGFIVYLSGFSDPSCSSNPTGVYIYPNALGVTTDGAKAMLAAALAAKVAGMNVTILYDNSGSISAGLCYGEYLEVQ